jgi:hypothetical protein
VKASINDRILSITNPLGTNMQQRTAQPLVQGRDKLGV